MGFADGELALQREAQRHEAERTAGVWLAGTTGGDSCDRAGKSARTGWDRMLFFRDLSQSTRLRVAGGVADELGRRLLRYCGRLRSHK